MSQQTHRANLSAAIYPMTLAKAGRSVIIPQTDQVFDKRVDSPGDLTKSVGIPQAIYMENVLPAPDGFHSIGLKPRTAITIPATHTVRALQQVYFASSLTTTETSAVVDTTDAGDQLETWTKSADFFARVGGASLGDTGSAAVGGVTKFPPTYCEIAESTGVGNPVNSYRMAALFTNENAPLCFLYKDVNFKFLTDVTLTFDVRWDEGTGTDGSHTAIRRLDFGVGSQGLNGPRFIYDSAINECRIMAYTNTTFLNGQVTIGQGTVTTPPSFDTWYRVTITSLANQDGTRTITGTCRTIGGGDLEIFSASGIFPATYPDGDMVHFWHAVPYAYTYFGTVVPPKLYIDNFTIVADSAVETNTKYSGVQTLYLAYHSNNTITWSRSYDTWDNRAVTFSGTCPTKDSEVSYGFARGNGFVCIRTSGVTKIYSLSVSGVTLIFTDITAVIQAGLPIGVTVENDILTISSSYNYFLLFTASTQYWSSTTTPTDFKASLVSGAGFEVPGNLKGDISFVKEHLAGIYIYTPKNVVFCSYTGNSKYPWKWREIGGSSGFTYSTQVAGTTNSPSQYGISDSKYIQELAPDQADVIAPEVTNFISTQTKWDIFNYSTNAFSLSASGTILDPTQPRISFVMDRYVVIPYGFVSGAYSYAIVFDTLLRRYGKIKATFTSVVSDDTDMYLINYLTGTISKVLFDIYDYSIGSYEHAGVLVLGKFQLIRSRLLQLEEVEIESAQDVDELGDPDDQRLSLIVLPSLDGKSFNTPVTPYRVPDSVGPLTHFLVPQIVGTNVSLAIKGAFDINTLQLVFTTHGDS